MPIEIRELIIRASVAETVAGNALTPGQIQQIKKELVKECLELVLEELALAEQR